MARCLSEFENGEWEVKLVRYVPDWLDVLQYVLCRQVWQFRGMKSPPPKNTDRDRSPKLSPPEEPFLFRVWTLF